MAERYSRLYSLTENLHTEGSPVVIAAGALLRDNVSGRVLAQMKLRNISGKTVTAVKVRIHALDTAKTPLEGVESFSYLDLSVAPDGEFGQNVPIVLPDAATRSFSVEIVCVVCADGEVFEAAGKTAAPAKQEVMNAIREQNEARAAEARRQREEKAAQEAADAKAMKKQILLGAIPLVLALLYVLLHMTGFRSAEGEMIPARVYFRNYGIACVLVLLAPVFCLIASVKKKQIKGVLLALGCVAIVILLLEIAGGYLTGAVNLIFPNKSIPKQLLIFARRHINWIPGNNWMLQVRNLLLGGKTIGLLRNMLPMIISAYTAVLAFIKLKKK